MGRLSDYINGSGSGIKFSVDEGAIELNVKNIEGMMTDNPELREKLQEAIREDVWKARNSVVNSMKGIFDNGDPAEARGAVRNIVYESVLGANLNIRDMKRGTASWRVRQVDRKVEQNPRMRGGNRRKRTFKTVRMHGYEGKAKGFLLRWLNNGVNDRAIKFKERMSRKADKWNTHPNSGNRGSIAARNFFEPMASAALNVVSQHLAQIIEEEIERQFNENNNG